MQKQAIYLGRFSPIHIGHEYVIQQMLNRYGYAGTTIILGSPNAQPTMRHIFTSDQRWQFIKQIFPQINIYELPDYPTDEAWLAALKNLLGEVIGSNPMQEARFYAGFDDDVELLKVTGYKVTIINRYDGTTPVVSATQVRERLMNKEQIEGLVNPIIIDAVQRAFDERLPLVQ